MRSQDDPFRVTRTTRQPHKQRRVFTYVALAVLGIQLVMDLQATDMLDADTAFVVQVAPQAPVAGSINQANGKYLTQSVGVFPNGRAGRTSALTETQAAAAATAGVDIGSRVLNAMGAGAVASVIQAALSAVGEPIVNRVLVNRMAIMDAVRAVSPAMMLSFFQTTLITNFLKFPLFEAINALTQCFPIPPSLRGIATGFVFTSATLPVTNYRYRKSMQLPVSVSNLYEAYAPTVIRDMAYGVIRNYATIFTLNSFPGWKIQDPQVLFIVVIIGCFGSAPFNEWRGYLLQTKGKKIPFGEFFKPSNFLRSTILGAFKQALSLAVGYWCTPPVSKFVHDLLASVKG